MLDETDTSDKTNPQERLPDVQKAIDEKLNRIANKAAMRIRMRQQRYDNEHGIFTK